MPRQAITIAGFDPSGGAGVLRDLEELRALSQDAAPLAAITALTVQDGVSYLGHETVNPGLLRRQLETLRQRFDIGFVKIGMLSTRAIVEVVSAFLEALDQPLVVLDPVLGASAGGALLDEAGLEALRAQLLPMVTLITPNEPELRRLLGNDSAAPPNTGSLAALRTWVGDARAALGVDVLLTGGHLPPPMLGTDFLASSDGVTSFVPERVAAHGAHGTGCTFSSALLAARAAGKPMPAAIAYAKQRVVEWIESQ